MGVCSVIILSEFEWLSLCFVLSLRWVLLCLLGYCGGHGRVEFHEGWWSSGLGRFYAMKNKKTDAWVVVILTRIGIHA
jgi:hypothetical protein